jgi:hypothetical protein
LLAVSLSRCVAVGSRSAIMNHAQAE